MKKCVDPTGNVISSAEQLIIDNWKGGFIHKVHAKDVMGLTENGGVQILCADGIIDACCFHKALIHVNSNPFRVFAGPLIFSESYGGFNLEFAKFSIENIIRGMKKKGTTSLFPNFHYPCGMMEEFCHPVEMIPQFAEEAIRLLSLYFNPEKIHPFFHTRRLDKGVVEQNTYKLAA